MYDVIIHVDVVQEYCDCSNRGYLPPSKCEVMFLVTLSRDVMSRIPVDVASGELLVSIVVAQSSTTIEDIIVVGVVIATKQGGAFRKQ